MISSSCISGPQQSAKKNLTMQPSNLFSYSSNANLIIMTGDVESRKNNKKNLASSMHDLHHIKFSTSSFFFVFKLEPQKFIDKRIYVNNMFREEERKKTRCRICIFLRFPCTGCLHRGKNGLSTCVETKMAFIIENRFFRRSLEVFLRVASLDKWTSMKRSGLEGSIIAI